MDLTLYRICCIIHGDFLEMEIFPMKKAVRFLVPLLLLIVIVGSIFWYLFIYDRDFTRDPH